MATTTRHQAMISGAIVFLVFLIGFAHVADAANSTLLQPDGRWGYGGGGGGRRFATRCQNRNSPCYNVRRSLCPRRCRGNCYIDCTTCGTRCNNTPSPPPPPPPTTTPSPPPPTTTPSPPPPTETPPPPPPTPTPSPPTETPPTPPTTTPPPPSSSPVKRVRCTNRRFPLCFFKQFNCPSTCPQTCEIDCITCRPVCNCDRPGTVCQDPKFVGADGITFYFHGKKDRDFCLVTDPNLHINGHFIGKRNKNMGRDFTWVQSLGILFDDHKLYLGARNTSVWNDAVDRVELILDDEPIYLLQGEGSSWKSTNGDLVITRSEKTNGVIIEAKDNFKIRAKVVPITQTESIIHNYGITNDDSFAHLDLSFRFSSLTGEVNGVLGQTYANSYVSRVNVGLQMPVLGGDKEFSTSNLFSTDCQVSRFMGKMITSDDDNDNSVIQQFADLSCTGGGGGTAGGGVVCKR